MGVWPWIFNYDRGHSPGPKLKGLWSLLVGGHIGCIEAVLLFFLRSKFLSGRWDPLGDPATTTADQADRQAKDRKPIAETSHESLILSEKA